LIWKGTSARARKLGGSAIGMSLVVMIVGQAMFDPALVPM
jgi:hypothetical protein